MDSTVSDWSILAPAPPKHRLLIIKFVNLEIMICIYALWFPSCLCEALLMYVMFLSLISCSCVYPKFMCCHIFGLICRFPMSPIKNPSMFRLFCVLLLGTLNLQMIVSCRCRNKHTEHTLPLASPCPSCIYGYS